MKDYLVPAAAVKVWNKQHSKWTMEAGADVSRCQCQAQFQCVLLYTENEATKITFPQSTDMFLNWLWMWGRLKCIEEAQCKWMSGY